MASKSKIYSRSAALILLVVLQGCLPLGAPTIISLAVDGVSYMATGKTVADHALSQLAQRDCSFGRAVLTGNDLCRKEKITPPPAIQNIELASQPEENDNPLYNTMHPSRWPLPAELR